MTLDTKASCRGAMALGMVLLASACTAPRTEELQRAEQRLEQARVDPMVQARAADELGRAENRLAVARQANEVREQRHLSYLAEKQAEIALARASERTDRAEFGRLATERDKAIREALTSRTLAAEQRARLLELERGALAERAQQLEAETAALNADLQALQAKQTERGLVLTLGDVLFETGKAELTGGGNNQLARLATFLRDNPDYRARIEGHTDSTGSDAFNMQLSQARAEAVMAALMAQGVEIDRLTAQGLGEQFPLAPNDNVAGRQQNRRVEIIIDSPRAG